MIVFYLKNKIFDILLKKLLKNHEPKFMNNPFLNFDDINEINKKYCLLKLILE
jgi:hypothetical protein